MAHRGIGLGGPEGLELLSLWCDAEMGQMAAELALKDAGLDYRQVEAVAASYCYGDPTSGEHAHCDAINIVVIFSPSSLSCSFPSSLPPSSLLLYPPPFLHVGQKAVYGKYFCTNIFWYLQLFLLLTLYTLYYRLVLLTSYTPQYKTLYYRAMSY